MKRVLTSILFVLTLCGAAFAQSEDRGLLQAFLEDNLSDAGRDVRITGFEGALSGRATLEQLTIADDDGVWLTITNAVFDWNRGRLFRGELDIEELSAETITITRPPLTTPQRVQPEATPFALPELPVSVRIGTVSVPRLVLGSALIGEDAVFALEGSAELASGEGQAALNVVRLEGKDGLIDFAGAFSNSSRVLDLSLDVREGPRGIAANLLGLPGRPSLRLSVDGTDPIANYSASIALETDGQTRLSGGITLTEEDDAQRFSAQISGDLRPLVKDDYRAFLGPELRLSTSGARFSDGRLEVSDMAVSSQAMTVTGALALDPDGWPERVDVTGRIASQTGGAVLLSLPGPKTWLNSAELDIQYDGAAGDTWTVSAAVDRFRRDGLAVDRLFLGGAGQLSRDLQSLDGAFQLALSGMTQSDPGLNTAVGQNLSGALTLEWRAGAPLQLSAMDLTGEDYRLTGAAEIQGIEGQVEMEVLLDARLEADQLSRFADLSGQPLSGAAAVALEGRVAPISGAFDLRLSGTGRGLSISQPQVDALIGGQSSLALAARRNETGVTLDSLTISTATADLSVAGRLATDTSQFAFGALVADADRVFPGLSGKVELNGSANQRDQIWTVRTNVAAPGGVDGTIDATIDLDAGVPQTLSGRASLVANQLSDYAAVTGLKLTGGADFTANGSVQFEDLSFDLDLMGQGTDIALGNAKLDPLISGLTTVALELKGAGPSVTIDLLNLRSRAAEITASGILAAEKSQVTYSAQLVNVGRLVEGLTGKATSLGTLTQTGPQWEIGADFSAPGSTSGRVDASVQVVDGEPRGVTGELQLSSGDVSAFNTIVGQTIAGAVTVNIAGSGDVQSQVFAGALKGSATSLKIGQPEVDKLLQGDARVSVDLSRGADGVTTVERLNLQTPQVTADLSGQVGRSTTSLRYSAFLRDVGLFVSEIRGSASSEGTVRASDGPFQVEATARGPGGISATVTGRVERSFEQANLAITGAAPLGIVNRFVAPNLIEGTATVDLRLDGPVAVSALSGTVRTNSARATLPSLATSLNDIAAEARIASGRADINVDAAVSSGGRLGLGGQVGLSSPFQSDLSVTMTDVGVREAGLYETSVDGGLRLIGALAGGASISGAMALGPTEVRIPDGASAVSGSLPGLVHLNEPAAVRQTRVRAGLLNTSGGGGLSVRFPLDVSISAPSRIFVRGRGLDAELGGALQLQGTTADVVTAGRFDLIRGRLDILGNRLVLSEASAQLQGDFDPFIRAVATTVEGDTTITITVEGPASAPTVTMASVPDLPEDEILARLLFGRDITEISAFQALQIANAIRVLSGQGGEGVVGRLRQNFGLDDLDVSTNEEGTAGLRVGRYINENVYTDVTVDTTGRSEINLNLTLSPSVTVRGSTSSDGNTGIGLFFERDY